ncbi:MAG TPA: DEAD/DEAH box helicase [Gemmataceae bacterium]|nr:DEAD/DEAH box helicase [Gemmataceae bacterium]
MALMPAGMDLREPDKRQEKRRKKKKKAAKLSRLAKPEDMSLEDWQIELRRQFGRDQNFAIKNLGAHPVFSEFEVVNPQSKTRYRVAIRGAGLADNFCSCPDFATNALGTCKHIEFTLARIERRRGGKSALRAGFQPPHSEIFLQYGARREVRFRPGGDCPVELARLSARFFGSDGTLLQEAFARFETFLAEANKFDHDLRCYEDVLAFVAEVRDAERRREQLGSAFPRGIGSAAWNKLLKVPLYDYQREGALFAARAGRALIGDEMGLGKTVQALAAAEIMANQFGVERVLIICPTSLKHQWEREIARFAERPTEVVGGLRARREQHFATNTFYKITNYDTIHRDLDLIQTWSPDLVVLDEAQRIKNWNTRAARSVKRINSPYAVVLTGTPLENRLEELVSIVQFVDRYRLGPTYRLLHEHQLRDQDGKVIGYQKLDRIGKTLEPILIRRQKKQVLDQLPERLDKNFFVPMTPLQQKHHEENREIVARIVSKWRRYKFLSEADQRRLMIALQNMRMACDSTYLLDHESDHGVKADELATLLAEIYEEKDTKVVIFSQWLRMHELLLRRFKEREWDHVLFHGGVPGPQRKHLIDRFREDGRCRSFLATDAGGVGLNLQHASVVINMDLPWNPAVLEQRVGRVHRLGQKQPVRVVNFVAKGTIEEGMLEVIRFKKSLFAGVLDGGEKEVFLGGSRLTKFMETVENATRSIPAASLEDRSEESRAAENGAEEAAADVAEEAAAPRAAPAALADPFAGLLQTGVALLQQLAGAARPGATATRVRGAPQAGQGLSFLARDERTGESYLRFPMPNPEVLDRALQAFSTLLEGFRK